MSFKNPGTLKGELVEAKRITGRGLVFLWRFPETTGIQRLVGEKFFYEDKVYVIDSLEYGIVHDVVGLCVSESVGDEQITPEEYHEGVLKTESVDFDAISRRLSNTETIRLLHAAIGMVTEAGEFIDQLKKHVYYGKPLDKVNLAEEIGDTQWYANIGLSALGTTMRAVMRTNLRKLALRYRGKKFSETHAQDRNLAAEREVLESKC